MENEELVERIIVLEKRVDELTRFIESKTSTQTCESCEGTGRFKVFMFAINDPCYVCGGKGKVRIKKMEG